jgi:hypothetical protein
MPNNPHTPFRLDDPLQDYKNYRAPTNIDPLVINWKGKIGYGDIISPISYAANIADKNRTDVVLRFHWDAPGPKKYKPEDKETIQDWVEYTYNYIKKPRFYNLTIEHVYNSKLDYNHDNYDYDRDDMPYHNMRFGTYGFNYEHYSHDNFKNVAMVTSIKHKQLLHEYDPHKAWKDPLGQTPSGFAWPKVCALIKKRGWNLKYVHYEDKMDDVVKKLNMSCGVIGYHGAHMWVARMLGLPMIVFSEKELSERAFPWAIRFKYYSDFHPENIDEYFAMSIQKREEAIREYKYYLTHPNIHRLRQQRS